MTCFQTREHRTQIKKPTGQSIHPDGMNHQQVFTVGRMLNLMFKGKNSRGDCEEEKQKEVKEEQNE